MSHEQYEKLKELAAFVSGDEAKLRGEFDYENMMHFNILLWRKALFPQANADEYEKLLPKLGGPYTFSTKYMKVTQAPGGTGMIGSQNTVYYISASPKYEVAQKKLDSFLESVLLPQTVKDPLAALKATAHENIGDAMFDVLNEKYKANPQNFILESEIMSPYHGNISYAYRRRVKPLKPDADKVVKAIQSYLRIN